ncbi:MAG: hypothetical protein ACW98J_10795 [Candidatus Thorarchaeota archaeon]|jgi:hypothetical protein
MKIEKWKLVGGRVYRLAQVFDKIVDATIRARELKENNRVFLSKTSDARWAVYYRPMDLEIECAPKYFNVV